MRRIRHLEQCDYIIPIGQRTSQVLTLSGLFNCLLQRTWDNDLNPRFELNLHAKFDSNLMNGIQFMAELTRNLNTCSSYIQHFSLYRVNESNWSETFISNVTATQSGNRFTGYIPQSTLAANELSGFECYAVEVLCLRRRKSFKKKVWFNHLGCYDSIIRLKHSVEYLEAVKVTE